MAVEEYETPRRVDPAGTTEEAILASAYALFRDHGYARVTLGDIAEGATVAAPTVYHSVGGKATILTRLVEPAVNDSHVSDTLTAVDTCEDAAAVLDMTARGARLTHEKHWPVIFELFHRRPPREPSVKAALDWGDREYVQALNRVAERLVQLGTLASNVPAEEVPDVLWFYFGPQSWLTLVAERGWSFDAAQGWVARNARRALLGRE